jgi:hypothetical protein
MKNKHILNIGYPKCGTTWLWDQLVLQPWFTSVTNKENDDLCKGIPVAEYSKIYLDSSITANFCPVNFALDRYLINQLSLNTHVVVTIIFRNPFDFYWSWYNFLGQQSVKYSDFVRGMIEQKWANQFFKIIDRWQRYFSPDRFFAFSYDELTNDPSQFLKNYCKTLNLPDPITINTGKINVTKYTYSNRSLDSDLIDIINNDIDLLQQKVSFPVLHWKQN